MLESFFTHSVVLGKTQIVIKTTNHLIIFHCVLKFLAGVNLEMRKVE